MKTSNQDLDALRERAARIGLHGLVARWDEVGGGDWILPLVALEEEERAKRSLERRVRNAKIGAFKPMCDFDWSWPKRVDRVAIEELFHFEFLGDAANVVLIGSNGLGKTTIAQNLAHAALLAGHTALFVSASVMLNDLVAQDGPSALARRLRRYVRPQLLVIDEVGYLSYGTEHADLLFDIVNRRNQDRSTVVTTNKEFREWNEVFPNSASVVALIDRLVHRSEIVHIEGESYRLKEAKEREEERAKQRAQRKRRSQKKGGAK
ncbi:MAG: ATP-binding protein [Planctomycetota bacterium]